MITHDLATGFTLALDHRALIQGALKRGHIVLGQTIFDDALQESYLLYAQTWAHSQLELKQFNPFIFQKIVWRALDWWRAQAAHRQIIHDSFLPQQLTVNATTANIIDHWLAVEQLVPQLTKLQLIILQQHFCQGITLKNLAPQLKVSERYLRQQRAHLRQQLRLE